MGLLTWLQENWFDLLQTTAIVGGYVSMRRDKKKERVQNWLYFTARHADLSKQQAYDPKLSRIPRADIDLSKAPVTQFEENHIRERIDLLAATHYANKNNVFTQPTALPE